MFLQRYSQYEGLHAVIARMALYCPNRHIQQLHAYSYQLPHSPSAETQRIKTILKLFEADIHDYLEQQHDPSIQAPRCNCLTKTDIDPECVPYVLHSFLKHAGDAMIYRILSHENQDLATWGLRFAAFIASHNNPFNSLDVMYCTALGHAGKSPQIEYQREEIIPDHSPCAVPTLSSGDCIELKQRLGALFHKNEKRFIPYQNGIYTNINVSSFTPYLRTLIERHCHTYDICRVLFEIATDHVMLATDEVDKLYLSISPNLKNIFVMPYLSTLMADLSLENPEATNILRRELFSIVMSHDNKALLLKYSDWHKWLTPLLCKSSYELSEIPEDQEFITDFKDSTTDSVFDEGSFSLLCNEGGQVLRESMESSSNIKDNDAMNYEVSLICSILSTAICHAPNIRKLQKVFRNIFDQVDEVFEEEDATKFCRLLLFSTLSLVSCDNSIDGMYNPFFLTSPIRKNLAFFLKRIVVPFILFKDLQFFRNDSKSHIDSEVQFTHLSEYELYDRLVIDMTLEMFKKMYPDLSYTSAGHWNGPMITSKEQLRAILSLGHQRDYFIALQRYFMKISAGWNLYGVAAYGFRQDCEDLALHTLELMQYSEISRENYGSKYALSRVIQSISKISLKRKKSLYSKLISAAYRYEIYRRCKTRTDVLYRDLVAALMDNEEDSMHTFTRTMVSSPTLTSTLSLISKNLLEDKKSADDETQQPVLICAGQEYLIALFRYWSQNQLEKYIEALMGSQEELKQFYQEYCIHKSQEELPEYLRCLYLQSQIIDDSKELTDVIVVNLHRLISKADIYGVRHLLSKYRYDYVSFQNQNLFIMNCPRDQKPNLTPLHLAVWNCNETIVRVLIEEFGANIFSEDSNGLLPLDYAIRNGSSRLVCILEEAMKFVELENDRKKLIGHD